MRLCKERIRRVLEAAAAHMGRVWMLHERFFVRIFGHSICTVYFGLSFALRLEHSCGVCAVSALQCFCDSMMVP